MRCAECGRQPDDRINDWIGLFEDGKPTGEFICPDCASPEEKLSADLFPGGEPRR